MKRIVLSALTAYMALNSISVYAYKNITQQQANQRSAQIGEVNYTLSIKLEKQSPHFDGISVARFELKDPSQDVVFDFDGKLVRSVTINGEKTSDFNFDMEQESIVLPKRYLHKGENTVSIDYVGNFTDNGAGMHQFVDPADNKEYYYTDFEPADAHRFFPHFDQPSLKATYTLDVNAPSDWRLISNMPVAKSSENGTRKHSYFQTSIKMSSYLVHLSAGPYAMWEDYSGKYPMRIFTRQSLAKYMDPEHMFETTKKGFTYFEDYYDYDYPFVKYDQIFVPEFNAGAMENAGAVTFSEYMVFRNPPTARQLQNLDVTILHEMAHMWFGDLVTMAWWDDLWLNESFADFMGYQGLAGIGSTKAWESASRRKNWAYYEDQLVTTHPIIAEIPDILSASANFDGITYAKGLAALRQLEYFIGAEAFRDGIRIYFKKHAFKNTKLEDFIAALEQAYGKDLSPWVDAWLGTKDVNSIKLAFNIEDGKISAAQIKQMGGKHNDTLRPHANLIGLYYEQDNELVLKDKIKVLYDGALTQLPELNGKAAPAVILPNVGDYDYVKIRFDDNSLAWLKNNIAKVKDSGTKFIVWNTLWDMVRDQELKANDYLALLIDQLPQETDVNFLSSQLNRLGDITFDYNNDLKLRYQVLERFNTIAKQKVSGLEAGSDLQRLWYNVLVSTSYDNAQMEYLAQIYDGKVKFDGIEVKARRKWDILEVMAEHNFKSMVEQRMSVLLEHDKSARGKNSALEVGASYPDLKVKQRVWDALTQQSSYSLREKRALGSGLYNSAHPELAKPFIAKYFKQVELLNEKGAKFEDAAFFIGNLFPEYGYEETVVAAETFLKTAEVPKTYKTLMLKSLDELKRTIAVRTMNL